MYTQEYEFTAVHEAGHAICIAQFPPANTALTSLAISYPEILSPRLIEIEIWYDKERERFDGRTPYSPYGLNDEQLLFIALGGLVAELMARADRNCDTTAIQKQVFSGRLDDTKDMEDIRRYLDRLSKDRPREEISTSMISYMCSALERNWELVLQIATELLSKCDPETHEGMILYDEFSSETQARLKRLRDKR